MDKTSDKYWALCIYLILALTTLVVFWQVRNHDFVNYDDPFYVYRNQNIQSGITLDSIKWAFTTGHAGNWHPLTWLSHMLDWQLFGPDAGWHHLTNLFLHIANTLLLFAVLKRMTGALWRSAFVAALFALHPLHVESVAWVAERKDVLSTLFWILTMAAYLRYVKQPCLSRYCLVVASLVLGLMAKPMLVTLPFVLLLIDYWPLDRIQLGVQNPRKARPSTRLPAARLIAEKVPLFVLILASSIVTFIVQQKAGAMHQGENFSFTVRAANASISYLTYITKMIWPARLAMFYPHPGDSVSIPYAAFSTVVLVVITIGVVRYARSHRYLPVGWFWYLGTLVPVIGLVQVGTQAMSDRYSYVPLTGLFIIIAWGLPELPAKWRYRKYALPASAMMVMIALAICAHFQQRYWKNSITLCEHALAVTENNYKAHFCMTELLRERGRFEEAIWHNSESIRIKPDYLEALNGLGLSLCDVGRTDEAITYYRRALEINPRLAEAHANLGTALVKKGNLAEAVWHYKQALRKFDSVAGRRSLAHALLKLGRFPEAIREYRRVLRVLPDDPYIHNRIGVALFKDGKIDEAIAHVKEALRLKPDFADAKDNLRVMLAERERL
ncbi:MAG: tetratricopeptide repeat protein [Planctomycetota bacterium]|jgi:Flp pilus assembly protein TadD